MVGKRCEEGCELLGFPVYGTIKRGNMENLKKYIRGRKIERNKNEVREIMES